MKNRIIVVIILFSVFHVFSQSPNYHTLSKLYTNQKADIQKSVLSNLSNGGFIVAWIEHDDQNSNKMLIGCKTVRNETGIDVRINP